MGNLALVYEKVKALFTSAIDIKGFKIINFSTSWYWAEDRALISITFANLTSAEVGLINAISLILNAIENIAGVNVSGDVLIITVKL